MSCPRSWTEGVGTLRDLFDRTGLLLLRDVELTAEDQAYLVGVLTGETAPADRAAALRRTHTYANYVSNKDEDGYARFGELLFHCDMMWAEKPTEVISLYGHRVDPPTVPTRFASMARALETLPADLRRGSPTSEPFTRPVSSDGVPTRTSWSCHNMKCSARP